MKSRIKTVIAISLLAAVCVTALILDLSDRTTDVYPNNDTMIRLYGEMHGVKKYHEIEFELWKDLYNEGYRDLFVELPYYSAEFINIWMKQDNDQLLDLFFDEIRGTQYGNKYYHDFFCNIKANCPETVFHGTDVGHQYKTTGARYLNYLEEHGLTDSENYKLAQECIRQGEEYYATRTTNDGISPVREAYMVTNFRNAYDRCGSGRIMGIYGSYHTDLSDPDLMAGQLKSVFGEKISSVKMSSIVLGADTQNPYRLGFCITGLIYLIMLFVPNIIWGSGRKPAGYDEAEKRENKVLLAFERIGQVAATVSVLIFPAIDPLIKILPDGLYFKWRILFLITAFILMILYECYWIKYFKSTRTLEDMYSSFAGFPVAGATLPVLALLLMGIYSRNLIVIASSIILGVGHIGIHLKHLRDI